MSSQENQPSSSPGLHTSHSTPTGSLAPGAQPFPHQTSAQPQLQHSSSFALAFTDNAYPMHRVCLGLLSGYKGVSSQPALAESHIPARESPGQPHTLDHECKAHSYNLCCSLSPGQLTADPCLALQFL